MELPISEGELAAKLLSVMPLSYWCQLATDLERVVGSGYGSVTIQVERARPSNIIHSISTHLAVDEWKEKMYNRS